MSKTSKTARKLAKCPKCGSTDLGDRWIRLPDRKMMVQHCDAILDELEENLRETQGENLRQEFDYESNEYVFVCNWIGEPREPVKRKIERKASHLYSRSSQYTVYNRYGSMTASSQGFPSIEAARPDIDRVLRQGLSDACSGPYTVLWWQHGKYCNHAVEVKLTSEADT